VSRRLRYLGAMGVDVWVRRLPRTVEVSGARSPEMPEDTGQRPASRPPSTEPAGVEPGAVTGDLSPRQAWRKMVDGLVPETMEPAVVIPEPIDGVPAQRAELPAKQLTSAPKVHLGLMGDDEICLVFELPDGVATDQGRQRFAQDVTLALGRRSVRFLDFRWPMLRSEHQDQSEPILRQTLTDQMRGFGKKRLLFGDVVAEYVDQSIRVDAVVALGIETVMVSADQKRALWESLRGWRSAVQDASLPDTSTDD